MQISNPFELQNAVSKSVSPKSKEAIGQELRIWNNQITRLQHSLTFNRRKYRKQVFSAGDIDSINLWWTDFCMFLNGTHHEMD